MDDEDKYSLILTSKLILAFAIYDLPFINRSFNDLMENSIEINDFYKIARMSVNIWMPEFILN